MTATEAPLTGDPVFVLRVLTAFAQVDAHGELFWRTDGKHAPVSFFANVNDVFWWACADLEAITPDNVAELERAVDDILALDGQGGAFVADLFAARVRGMRPQGACYRYYTPALWPLFDAAGPERDPREPCNTPRPKPTETT